MKKVTFCLLVSTALFSCGKPESSNSSKAKVNVRPVGTLSVECEGPNNCSSTTCQEEIVKIHEIDEATLDGMIEDYYDVHNIDASQIPIPLIMPSTAIAQLTNLDCATNRIGFNLAEDDLTTHENMTLFAVAGFYRPITETNSYSIALFKGILNRGANSFQFSRALSNGHATMAIKAFDQTNTLVYAGDLSDLIP